VEGQYPDNDYQKVASWVISVSQRLQGGIFCEDFRACLTGYHC